MATTLEPPTGKTRKPEIDVHAFEHHWQDEADAAYLYRLLSAAEPDPKKKDIYARLADVEDRHVDVWGSLLSKHGHRPAKFRPSGRARLLGIAGRWFGPGFLLPMLLEEEGREVRAYLDMHRATPSGAPGGAEALTLARESAEHASTLGEISGKGGEPWHRTGSGGFLRNVVYGFNDGLTANFGLVAGVVGAGISNQHEAIVVAGVAGLIADALSMGSSGYLASKSEREVYEYEIAMEKVEVELMPEIERDELAVIYESKGMDRATAHDLATQIMADPKLMLKEQVQEELKIGEMKLSPMREGWITGTATAFGAAIPVFPFLIWQGTTAITVSFAISMLSHFLVGAARSIFTGPVDLHRPQRLPLRAGHVRGRRRRGGCGLLCRRVGRSVFVATATQKDTDASWQKHSVWLRDETLVAQLAPRVRSEMSFLSQPEDCASAVSHQCLSRLLIPCP